MLEEEWTAEEFRTNGKIVMVHCHGKMIPLATMKNLKQVITSSQFN